MIRCTATAIATALVAVAAIIFGVWLAVTGRRSSTPRHIEPPEPPPPSLDDERDEVVAEVETMERDEIVADLNKRGF